MGIHERVLAADVQMASMRLRQYSGPNPGMMLVLDRVLLATAGVGTFWAVDAMRHLADRWYIAAGIGLTCGALLFDRAYKSGWRLLAWTHQILFGENPPGSPIPIGHVAQPQAVEIEDDIFTLADKLLYYTMQTFRQAEVGNTTVNFKPWSRPHATQHVEGVHTGNHPKVIELWVAAGLISDTQSWDLIPETYAEGYTMLCAEMRRRGFVPIQRGARVAWALPV